MKIVVTKAKIIIYDKINKKGNYNANNTIRSER